MEMQSIKKNQSNPKEEHENWRIYLPDFNN